MKLVFSEIFAPVLPLRLTASVHSQGDATVFEKMAMSLVSIGSESDELRGHTIPALFEILIQGRLDDDIVDRTVEDLFSPANGLLAVANPDILFSTYRDIPVSEIEILPAGSDDIAVNFIVLPQFFDTAFDMLRDESILRDFLIGTLSSNNTMGNYLHFQVSDILPVQNLLENMIWALVNDQQSRRNINQTTMGLLLMQLVGYTDRLSSSDPNQYEQNLVFTCLKYIEENYKTATLTELSGLVSMPDYQLSRFIRQHAGGTFKELLQRKRLNQAAFLLSTTKLPVEHIISVVGYDNTSYFHRIFRSHFGMSPKDYRLEHSS